MKEKIKKTAWDASLYYLGIRSRTEYEIKTYLKKKEYEDSEISDCISRLYELDLINDRRFCEEYLHHAISSNMSRLQFISKLKHFGVTKDLISETSNQFNSDDEMDCAKVLFDKYLKQFSALDNSKKILKIKQRLSSKGFSYSTISRLFSENSFDINGEENEYS